MTQTTDEQKTSALTFREPSPKDGAAIHQLVDTCKPLDLNSLYSYLLIADHFAATSVVVEDSEGIGGFISAYIPPQKADTVFVWQVAVHPRLRGQGLAGRMLKEILERNACCELAFLETTISPSNTASRRLFASLAEKLGTKLTEIEHFTEEHFGSEAHESEVLHRIGPLKNH